jgi:hypothetical protein
LARHQNHRSQRRPQARAFLEPAETNLPPMKRADIARQVADVLQLDDRAKLLEALAPLQREAPLETLEALIGFLDHPDQKLRRLAGSLLSRLRDHAASRAEALAGQLCGNADPRVRSSCAIVLMSVTDEVVTRAFCRALGDSFEKVAQIACVEVGHRGGAGSTEALMNLLGHAPWRVRLEACKALIVQGTADQRVIAALEAMSREPEAAVYDAEDEAFEEFARMASGVLGVDVPAGERWGKLATILAQAREVAAKRSRA